MKKTLIIMMAILLLMPVIFATDITPINQPMILWANFGINSSIVNIVNANATITDPNLLEVVTLQPMTADNPNTFYYNFTPNVSGTYLLSVQYGDNSGTFYISTSTFYAEENVDMLTAVMLGLIAIIIYFIYLGKDLMKQPTVVEENKGVQKWLNAQTVGVFTYMVASWLVLGLFFVLESITNGLSVNPFFETLFTIFLWVIPMINVGYWTFFVIFKIVTALKLGVRQRK